LISYPRLKNLKNGIGNSTLRADAAISSLVPHPFLERFLATLIQQQLLG